MNLETRLLAPLSLALAVVVAASVFDVAAAPAPGGTITGHVRLAGTLPGNPVIRMGRDPKCAAINTGKQVVQEAVAAAADGSLANVFVEVLGTFPDTPVPETPVTIDQRACIYGPRVVGVRVGQMLQIRNDDQLLHNVRSVSVSNTAFNVGQPLAGQTYETRFKSVERMVQLKCDVHSWMTAFIAVIQHPYFDVSRTTGTFSIAGVPPGTYTVQAWHERFGVISSRVRVVSGASAKVEFTYSGESAASPAPK